MFESREKLKFALTDPLGPAIVAIQLKRLSPFGKADTDWSGDIFREGGEGKNRAKLRAENDA